MNLLQKSLLAGFCTLALGSQAFGQATINIQNNDGPNEGFNDTTAVSPSGGNSGTTLGAQRLIVFQRAAQIWGSFLESDVDILVNAEFNALACDPVDGAVLGSAGAAQIFSDFPNAPMANTWYSVALANSLAQSDLFAGADINAQFNSAIDTGCFNSGWYYGLDGATPDGFTPLLPVVLHEMGHGLGFQTFTSGTSGALVQGRPDIWTRFMQDLETGEFWDDMTNQERLASTTNDPNLVWTGPNVTAEFPNVLGNPAVLTINSPAGLTGDYEVQTASFGPAIPDAGINNADVVLADDGTGPDANDACEAINNDLTGTIAIVNRGTCNFTAKVINAQNAGAIGVLVANNVPDGLPPMGGADNNVAIPSVGISQADGALITGSATTVNATLGYDTNNFAGVAGGFVRLFAPDPFQQGSSVSHWTTAANPNLLMEPSITSTIFDEIDLTLQLFQDIGWNTITVDDLIFENGFE